MTLMWAKHVMSIALKFKELRFYAIKSLYEAIDVLTSLTDGVNDTNVE